MAATAFAVKPANPPSPAPGVARVEAAGTAATVAEARIPVIVADGQQSVEKGVNGAELNDDAAEFSAGPLR